jgi:hypothetical protein
MTRTEKHDGDAIVKDDARITSGAERMQRSRERRRQGNVFVSLEVGPNAAADLIALGWLAAPDRGNKTAIARALTDLVERALWAARNLIYWLSRPDLLRMRSSGHYC